MSPQFIRVQNRFVRLDAIDYVDFMESGRSMIYIGGLSQEKQMISLDPDETRRLRAILEPLLVDGISGNARQEPSALDRASTTRLSSRF